MPRSVLATLQPVTNARGRRTRAALLAATRVILEEQGFEGLTMGAVAEQAGVTRRAVYLHFSSRAELVGALFDFLAEAEGLADSLERVWRQPDALSSLDAWVRHLASYHARLLPVTRAIERVRHVDADAAAHHAHVVRAQRANCRRLVRLLERDGQLRPEWTRNAATDMLWALISSDIVEGLLTERAWSPDRLAKYLALVFRSTFARQ
jgi:AcrR family transcriptional regulator